MPQPLFNKNLDVKLLKLVKEYPILYNSRHSSYLNFDAREVVWQKIGDALNRPAVEFAGIQCQIHFDDFQEEKHKPGYIENLNEFLPEQYSSSWGVEKKILKAFRKHQGLSQLDAKGVYIKTARDLPTYGVTFFLVKEKQKNKKKLVPRLLGINAEAILRLDENTKEILQVWPLTQVKTYHVGKAETFTLNFGDYSDKDYSVKTQDAYRIRDILEGYIDLIRKRLLAGREALGSEGMVITQTNVEASRGNIIQIVPNNPSKVMEQSFVGPSKLVPYANETKTGEGTQIVTMQQIMVTSLANNPQQALKGEVPMRSDLSMEAVRRLNKLNTQSVTLVSLLSDPSEPNVREARRTVDSINTDLMPPLLEGLNKCALKQASEESRKKMLEEIKELSEYVQQLTDSLDVDNVKCEQAGETAMKVANLSTQMYAEIDPKTKRRSDLIRKSRQSFIADEKMDSTLRRASFIAAAGAAAAAADSLRDGLQPYTGPALDKQQAADTEKAALDKLGKLNAAIALYLTAHTDPKLVDYSTAVNSMNTLKELMPELGKDIQALGSARDNKSRQQLQDNVRALCDATRAICSLTGLEDHEKMQEASNKYADVSRKLMFVVSKDVDKAKEAEIIKLAKAAVDKAALVQKAGHELAGKSKGADAKDVHDAAGHVAHCAKDLLTCARLTGQSPHEAHCRSALLAGSASTAAAAHGLLQRAAPHDKLRARVQDLQQALDAINHACAQLEDADARQSKSPEEMLRIQIMQTIAANKDRLQAVDDELNKPDTGTILNPDEVEKRKLQLARKIAQISASMATLVGARSDRSNPDHETSKLAVNTIAEVLPDVVREAKAISGSMDPASRDQLLEQIRALCQASRDVCAAADKGEDVNEPVVRYSNASGKLLFTLTPRQDNAKGQQVLDLSGAVCDKASQLLTRVHQLAESVGGARAGELDCKGVALVDRAQALLAAAQATSLTMSEPRCQSSMLPIVDGLAASSQQLAQAWRQLPATAHHQPLETDLQDLEKILDELRKACSGRPPGVSGGVAAMQPVVSPKEVQRLRFVKTVSRAKKDLQAADDELDKPDICQMMRQEDAEKMQRQLEERIQELNAAIASLLAASADRANPDYPAIEESMATVSKLLPAIAKDSKTLGSSLDDSSRSELLSRARALCGAGRDVCRASEAGQGLDAAASKFADASGQLVFTISPRSGSSEQQALDLATGACGASAELVYAARQLARHAGEDKQLEARATSVGDNAQALLVAVEKWAPTISEPGSRSKLLSAVETLSSSGQELANTWRQKPADARHQPLEKQLQDLEKILGQLRGVCHKAENDEAKKAADVKRITFVSSAARARENLQAAERDLDKPVTSAPLGQEDVIDKQHRLHHNIEELNAAVAALLAASADRCNPDYVAADKSLATINQLLPEVLQDSARLGAGRGAGRGAGGGARALCRAASDLCTAAEKGQDLSEPASKFAEASGKLTFALSPKSNVSKEQQVQDLSAVACGTVSQLLTNVQALAQQLGGDAGEDLDTKGAKAVDDAQALLAAVKDSASSLSEPGSQQSVLSAVDALSSSCQQVAGSWRQVATGPQRQALEREMQHLQHVLGQLREACHSAADRVPDRAVKEKPSPADVQRIKFVRTVAAAKENLAAADEELKKPTPTTPLSQDAAQDLQHQLQGELAQMSGAIAALVSSTADSSKPDYATAEQSVGVVTLLLPQIVKDAKTLSSRQDPAGREALMDRIRALCAASKDVCASADGPGLNEAASKYASASGKLVYVVNPRVDVAKGQKVTDLSAVACGTVSQLLSNVQALAQQLGGDAGEDLDTKGARVAEHAQALLTVSQITAPTIADPHCQASTLSSVDALASSSQVLAQAWRQQPSAPPTLEREQLELDQVLQQIREACKSAAEEVPTKPSEVRRMKFKTSASDAHSSLQAAADELDKPVVEAPLSREAAADAQQQLQRHIDRLNAAVASLLQSTDRSKPDYTTAEQAMSDITELVPQVVQQSKTLSAGQESAARDQLLQRARALCDAAGEVCACAEQGQGMAAATSNYASASQGLAFVVSPRPDSSKQLKNTVAAACGTTSQLLSNVQALAQQLGGDAGEDLDSKGARVADDAQALLATAQVTAPSMSDPSCRAAFLSSVDDLSSSSQTLAQAWRQLPPTPQHAVMEKEFKELELTLSSLRKECQELGDAQGQAKSKPSVPLRQTCSSPRSKVPPAVPRRVSSQRRSLLLTQEFLDRIRIEEGQGRESIQPTPAASATTTGDQKHHQQFARVVEQAASTIRDAEQDLKKVCDSGSAPGPKLNANQQTNRQKDMEQKLALANVEVAALVGANYADKIDYNTASKSIMELPELLTGIVEDGKSVSSSFSAAAREAFLADLLQYCAATGGVCEAAASEREKLKEAAIEFGDKSAKILYTVSSQADPDLEKQIINTAKDIGGSASRLAAACAARDGAALPSPACPSLPGGPSRAPLAPRAAATIDAAGALLYTAKLVAPAIHNATCKEALLASAYKLSNNLKDFSDSWKPLASDPQHASVQELTQESDKLVQLLEHLRRSVRGQQKVEEKKETLVAENTPLRVLACKIHQDAQRMSEDQQLPVAVRCGYAQYCDALRAALGAVDDAGIEARRSPADINKHRELENAIQNLQLVILQSRPNRDDREQSKIVDLRDYIQDVVSESDKLLERANQLESPRGKKALEQIKEHCHMISAGDAQAQPRDDARYDDAAFDDILHIDNYGQECESRIADIKSCVRALEEDRAGALQPRVLALAEACNVLRFATKSGLATGQGVVLDSVLDDLHELDTRVVGTLLEDQGDEVVVRRKGPPVPPKPWLAWRVSSAARQLHTARASELSAATAAYVTDAVTRASGEDPQYKARLHQHLSKLLGLLQQAAVLSSQRAASWQAPHHPGLAAIIDQIEQELEKPESGYSSSESAPPILNTPDIKKLLSSSEEVKVVGDEKQLQERVQKAASKLSMMSSTVVQGLGSASTRSAHAAADAARDLAASARGLKNPKEPVQSKRIEEAAQEMLFATHSLLATADHVAQRPEHPGSRVKLLDALRHLNDSINKLTRATLPGGRQQECEELCRSLQASHAALQATQQGTQAAPQGMQGARPACALSAAACLDALTNQRDVVDKLRSDAALPRAAFVQQLTYASGAVANAADLAAHCAYLVTISDQHKEAAKSGLFDAPKIQKSLAAIQDTCTNIVRTSHVENMQEDKAKLQKQVELLSEQLQESSARIQDDQLKRNVAECGAGVTAAADQVTRAIAQGCEDTKIRKQAMELLRAVTKLEAVVDEPGLQPQVTSVHPDTQARSEEVLNHARSLVSKTQALVRQVKASPEDSELMTWVTFDLARKQVLDEFDTLIRVVQVNGSRSGILEGAVEDNEDSEGGNKSYVQVQLETANKWLKRAACKPDTKMAGQQAVKNIITLGKKMCEDMKPAEREVTHQLVLEIEQLFAQSCAKYDQEKYSLLMDRLKELKKMIERDLVTRVVSELIEEEAPLQDLEVIETEKDEKQRQFLLERKIAELLAQLGRVTRVARLAADAGSASSAVCSQLRTCSDQSELLAPMLVKAAQERIDKPNDKVVVDNYKSLLARYADSLSRVRELCDQAVDPMDFVQTAGVMMEQMREASTKQEDPQACAKTSTVITKLANRVISVSMSSPTARRDPELQRALNDARLKLRAAIPAPDTRASRLPDWRLTTAEILRTTGEVESVLGGENIFNKQPEPDQPIYSVALNLHSAVREWSSRDNDVVAVARRVAVLMAKLSDYMNTDKQRELLFTSKQIVEESHEVAYLARKMAHECSDVRIKTNLLLACERIPTISAQLKMLTTVKGSSLGRQGTKEDKEAMNMLVDNAQSLMLSIQDVVKGAASASVKIMSQHGPRNRWVRRNYYY